MAQNTDPRQTPNYDPRTGQYHADPLWRRYEPDPNRMSNVDVMLGGLRHLFKPKQPTPAASVNPETQTRQAVGAQRQLTTDIELSPEIPDYLRSDPDINRRADAIIAQGSDSFGAPSPQSPSAPAFQGLQAALNPPPVERFAHPDAGEFGRASTANAPLELARLRHGQRQEQEERLFNALRAHGGATGAGPLDASGDIQALQGLLGSTKEAIAADPYTGEAAQAQTAAFDEATRQAQMQGYASPQEAYRAAQEAERYKQDVPIRAAQAAGGLDIERQKIASQGAIDVAKENAAAIQANQNFLQQLQGLGGANVRSFAPKTGAVSFGAEPRVANPILDAVTNARRQYEQALQEFTPFTSPEINAKSALDAAIASALSQHPADPTLKDFAQMIANTPEYANMALPQILETEGEDQLTPQEINWLQQLVYITRGR